MVEGYQAAAKPGDGLADIVRETHRVRLYHLDGVQCHQTKGHHPGGIENGNELHQMAAAIGDLAPGWAIIASLSVPWVAEHRIGDEDVASSQSDRKSTR